MTLSGLDILVQNEYWQAIEWPEGNHHNDTGTWIRVKVYNRVAQRLHVQALESDFLGWNPDSTFCCVSLSPSLYLCFLIS